MADISPTVTLGMPGLKKARLLINCEAKAWRWKLDGSSLLLQTPEGFAESLQTESRVFALAAYNFIIKHRAGKTNPADAPLRQPLGAKGPLKEDTMLPLL